MKFNMFKCSIKNVFHIYIYIYIHVHVYTIFTMNYSIIYHNDSIIICIQVYSKKQGMHFQYNAVQYLNESKITLI